MYDIVGLQHGIEQAKKHIQSFEDAILREKNTIKEYKIMINTLEKKKQLSEDIKKNITFTNEG